MPCSARTVDENGRQSIVLHGFVMVLVICASLAFGGHMASAQEVGTYAFVDVQALNLRAATGTESSVIRTLPRRTVVSILERKGGWARVFVQGTNGKPAEGWLSTRFLGSNAKTIAGLRSGRSGRRIRNPAPSGQFNRRARPLRVSQLDFDCRRPLFGNSGIGKCSASVRVQLSPEEYDPNRTDRVFVACRGEISYQTENNSYTERMVAVERRSISFDDRLGRSVRINFDVRSNKNKIVSAYLQSFSCARD